MRLTRPMLHILAVLAFLLLAGFWLGLVLNRRANSRVEARLLAVGHGPGGPSVDLTHLDSLPAPVARYLRHVLRDGQRPIAVARLLQTGTLRTDLSSDRWFPFDASHLAVPAAPGFLWNARVRMAPLLHVSVRDAYVDGHGSSGATLLSAIPMSGATGSHETDEASLHRYLAESPWYPTVLLPNPRLSWEAVDDTTAIATLSDGNLSVSLEFAFNDGDEVAGVFTPARWREVDGEYRATPWKGVFSSYRDRHGMLVPSEGEVSWQLDGVWQPVWRGRNLDVTYTLRPPTPGEAE